MNRRTPQSFIVSLVALALALSPACADIPVDSGSDSLVGDLPACEPFADWDEELTGFEDRVVELINEERRLGGRCGDTTFSPLPPLLTSPSLRCAARLHASAMRDGLFVDYQDPDDPEAPKTGERLETAGYDPAVYAEAIGGGWSDADIAVREWLASDAHCWKFMAEELVHVGIGVARTAPDAEIADSDGNDYGIYWDAVTAAPN